MHCIALYCVFALSKKKHCSHCSFTWQTTLWPSTKCLRFSSSDQQEEKKISQDSSTIVHYSRELIMSCANDSTREGKIK